MSHTFNNVGTVTVAVEVETDSQPTSATCPAINVIAAPAPVTPLIQASSEQVSSGDQVQFDDVTTPAGRVVSRLWTFPFGEPASSAEVDPLVRFTNNGTQIASVTVTLTVTTTEAADLVTTRTIQVLPGIAAASIPTGLVGLAESDARGLLSTAGFTNVSSGQTCFTEPANARQTPGIVGGVSPASGTFPLAEPIALAVSDGQATFVPLFASEAEATRFGATVIDDPSVADGQLVKQNTSGWLCPSTAVTVTVGSQPAPPTIVWNPDPAHDPVVCRGETLGLDDAPVIGALNGFQDNEEVEISWISPSTGQLVTTSKEAPGGVRTVRWECDIPPTDRSVDLTAFGVSSQESHTFRILETQPDVIEQFDVAQPIACTGVGGPGTSQLIGSISGFQLDEPVTLVWYQGTARENSLTEPAVNGVRRIRWACDPEDASDPRLNPVNMTATGGISGQSHTFQFTLVAG